MARTEERRHGYRVLVRKPKGKRQLGRHERRWEDNIKIHLQEKDVDVDWIGLAWDKERGNEPSPFVNWVDFFLTS